MTTETHGHIIYQYDPDGRIVAVDNYRTTADRWCVEHDSPASRYDRNVCVELAKRLDRRVAAMTSGRPVDWTDEYGDCQIVPNVTLAHRSLT